MVGIIVVGHGKFAEGLTSAVELIAGKQDNYEVLDFTAEITPTDLGASINAAMEKLNNEVGTVVFTDLLGGTPFKESVEASITHNNVRVIAGSNIAMLLEASLMRSMVTNIDEFVSSLVATGKDQVSFFDLASLEMVAEDNEEMDGI
jgi:N-acetylgalactosamine PTS system EIIA component